MPHTYTNGIVTFYEESGDGPAVVLIHGHSVDLRMWASQVPALLGAGFRAIRYDVRGHGRSMIPPDGYTWENYAADLAELLDRLNVERPATQPLDVPVAHIVGLSMGGGIALRFALDYPERVLSLTLVDSALPGFAYGDEITGAIEALRREVQAKGPQAFAAAWLPHPMFDGVRRHPRAFALIEDMVRGFQAPEYRGTPTVPEGYTQPETIGRLGEITCPTLVVVGEDDVQDFQFIAEILASAIPNARRTIIPGCGHVPPLEYPDTFNRILLDFLSRLAPDT